MGAQSVVVCMSTDLTQRGGIALLPPQVRAKAALQMGADLVLGLPNPCAVQSAEGFAAAGVAVLSALPQLDSLVFGAETPDVQGLCQVAEILQSEAFAKQVRGVNQKGTYYLRAYKKLAEFRAKNQLPPKKARESGVWDRYEISFTKDKAQQVVNKLLEVGSVGKVYFGVLRRLVEFLNPTKNGEGNIFKNKDNWRVCPWWDKFLKKTESVRIGSDVDRDLNFADLLAWIRRAVVPSLRLLEQIGDERGFNIYDLIQSCDVDFAKKQQRVLKDSRTIPDDLLQLYLRNFVEGE